MTTVPLDAPTAQEDLVGIHDYTAHRFREYDRAQAALANLRVAYRGLDEALKEVDAALDNVEVYDPEQWYDKGRPLRPADLRVPARVKQFLTHDPEHFLEADVLIAALHRATYELAERVEGDLHTIKRQMPNEEAAG